MSRTIRSRKLRASWKASSLDCSAQVVLQVRGTVPDVQTGIYPITTLRSGGAGH